MPPILPTERIAYLCEAGDCCAAEFRCDQCPLMGWSGLLRPRQQGKLARGTKDEEDAMPHKLNSRIAVIGIDIGKKLVSRRGSGSARRIVLTSRASLSRVATIRAIFVQRIFSARSAQ